MQNGACLKFSDGTFGQFLKHVDDTTILVSRMTTDQKNPRHLLLGDGSELALRESVESFHNITDLSNLAAHKRAWRKIGLRLVQSSRTQADVFVRSDEEGEVLLGDDDSDDDDDDDDSAAAAPKRKRGDGGGMHGYVSDGDFVVPDGTQEFTFADPDEPSGFVAEVHDAVNAFNDWAPPRNTTEHRFRTWMEQFERNIAHNDDDAQFVRGKSVNYTRPPSAAAATKRAKKTK